MTSARVQQHNKRTKKAFVRYLPKKKAGGHLRYARVWEGRDIRYLEYDDLYEFIDIDRYTSFFIRFFGLF